MINNSVVRRPRKINDFQNNNLVQLLKVELETVELHMPDDRIKIKTNFSNRKKIGQLTGAHMPERASRLRYDLTTASARKVPYQITISILNDPFRSLDLR